MGQKVDPRGLRVGITRSWDSNWYADKKEYAKYFHEDVKIRELIKKNYFHAGISKVKIERTYPLNEEQHFMDYFKFLEILILITIKINEEFCLYDEVKNDIKK